MTRRLLERIFTRVSGETGAASVEYAVVASLIAAVVVAAAMGVGTAANGCFQALSDVWP